MGKMKEEDKNVIKKVIVAFITQTKLKQLVV
jgi:hypothetical protein